jgi:hypothetical protein
MIFAGRKCGIIEQSPHGNFVVIELTKRVTVVGTFSNQFCWEESPDDDSGFVSFITYIGVRSKEEAEKVETLLELVSSTVSFKNPGDEFRKAKRNQNFPCEMKVRGLTVNSINNLLVLLGSA